MRRYAITFINARDPMQNLNLGQTQIFYKIEETRLTRTIRDAGDLTQFQPWYVLLVHIVSGMLPVATLQISVVFFPLNVGKPVL